MKTDGRGIQLLPPSLLSPHLQWPLSATSASTLPHSYPDPISSSELGLELPFSAQSQDAHLDVPLNWQHEDRSHQREGRLITIVKLDSSPSWHFQLSAMATKKALHKYTPLPQPADPSPS